MQVKCVTEWPEVQAFSLVPASKLPRPNDRDSMSYMLNILSTFLIDISH